MPGGKGNTLCNSVLNHVLGGPDYTRLTTVYIGLFTLAPSGAGGGTEVSGVGYARIALTNNATNFPNASNRVKTNGTLLDFGEAGSDCERCVLQLLAALNN